jgi:tRNA pseudouridine13 synthase
LTRLLISAYQSQLFNAYLALRIQRGLFDKIMMGDLAKKTDTGGMFVVEDATTDQARFDRRQITFTGPLFGYKMRQPLADAAALEAEILATSPVTTEQWRKHRTDGNRRVGRIFLQPIDVKPVAYGVRLSFYLPKGAYATILLREVMKPATPLPKFE